MTHQSPFLSHVAGSREASRFYSCAFGGDEFFRQTKQAQLPGCAPSTLRSLRESLAASPQDPALEKSVDKLSSGAVVVIAGQQPGLFGGPILSTFKAATAVRMARWLEDGGVAAVPVFWNASEDHDFDEADRLFLPTDDSGSTKLWHSGATGGVSLDRVIFSEEHILHLAGLVANFPGLTRDLPETGESLGSWCSRLFLSWFHGTGLVVVEPRMFSGELAGIFGRAVTCRAAARAAFDQTTQSLLDGGFQTPLSLGKDSLFLFRSDDSGRRRIRCNGNELTDGVEAWGEDDLVGAIKMNPAGFSSDAILRPLAQQEIFPVVAQIVGPSEGDYMAQLQSVYGVFDLPAPAAWPRMRGALLSVAEESLLESTGRGGEDLLWDASLWPLPEPMPKELAVLLEDLPGDPGQVLGVVRRVLGEADGNLERAVGSPRPQPAHIASAIKKSWSRIRRRKTRALNLLRERVWPRGRPQDRVFPLGAFGLWPPAALMDRIIAAADPLEPTPKTIVLPSQEKL